MINEAATLSEVIEIGGKLVLEIYRLNDIINEKDNIIKHLMEKLPELLLDINI